MPTYLDLQQTIADDYLNRPTLGNQVRRAITRAINTYQRKRHWFNEARTATATTVGSAYLGVPADFFALDRIRVINGQFNDPLIEQSFDYIQTVNAGSATGVPTFYHYRGEQWNLAPIPDSAYSVNIYYLKTLPALSADTDSNVWTNECFNLIAYQATYDLVANVLKEPSDAKLARFEKLLKQAQNELAEHDLQRLTTRLYPTE